MVTLTELIDCFLIYFYLILSYFVKRDLHVNINPKLTSQDLEDAGKEESSALLQSEQLAEEQDK